MRKFTNHVMVGKHDCTIEGHHEGKVMQLSFAVKTNTFLWTSTAPVQEFVENQYDYALEEEQLYDGLLEAIKKQGKSSGSSGPIKFMEEGDTAYLTWAVDSDELHYEIRVPVEGSMEQGPLPNTEIGSVQGPTPNATLRQSVVSPKSSPENAKDLQALHKKCDAQEARIDALERQVEELKGLLAQVTGGKIAASAPKKTAAATNGGEREATSSGQSEGKDASKKERDPTTGQAKTVASNKRGKRLKLGG